MRETDVPARWWHPHESGAVCRLCPHACVLNAHRSEGLCGLRFWNGTELRTRGWGGVAAVHLDPVEKKPLFHFMPGSKTFSLGMTGCNLSCSFCQNWSLSADRSGNADWLALTPGEIVARAQAMGAQSVAFTYNEPLIAAEFWLEVAALCHREGLKTIAVSNGYATPTVAREFYGAMNAVNIDLKAFQDSFYQQICGCHLAPVLHTLKEIRDLPNCHLEITTLLVAGKNDDAKEIVELSRWVLNELGADVPVHFTAFHPDYLAKQWTTEFVTTPQEARRLALAEGLRFVYTGNIEDPEGSATGCPGCGSLLIARAGFGVVRNRLAMGCCPDCGAELPGVW